MSSPRGATLYASSGPVTSPHLLSRFPHTQFLPCRETLLLTCLKGLLSVALFEDVTAPCLDPPLTQGRYQPGSLWDTAQLSASSPSLDSTR